MERIQLVDFDILLDLPRDRRDLWQFRMRLVLVEDNEHLMAGLVVDRHCIHVFEALNDWVRQRRKARVLLQRQTCPEVVLHGILHDAAMRDQLFGLELIVDALAFAEAHINQQQQRQAGHDEHRDPVDEAAPERCLIHIAHPDHLSPSPTLKP